MVLEFVTPIEEYKLTLGRIFSNCAAPSNICWSKLQLELFNKMPIKVPLFYQSLHEITPSLPYILQVEVSLL